MRPRVAERDGLQQSVETYAKEHGLKTRRAWADLVEAGLESEGFETDD